MVEQTCRFAGGYPGSEAATIGILFKKTEENF
jgi:hypothetical protein